jgi:hypothetical protein
MNPNKYILEPYRGRSTRYNCPKCQKIEFSRYIDTVTRKYIALQVGRCNREQSCGYHYTPSNYFQDIAKIHTPTGPSGTSINNEPVSCIPYDIFRLSLGTYEHNYFIHYLISLFGTDVTRRLIERYYVGTSRQWPGSVVFWQIDCTGKVRGGKIMLYDAITGKRRKDRSPEGLPYITWVHSVLKMKQYNLNQCLFGEHLLVEDKVLPVAIVESEKTAMISSVYMPNFLWLACGGLSNLSREKLKILKGRNVILWPDLKAYERWNNIAREQGFKCADFLEKNATEEAKKKGLDLADILIQWEYRDFLKLSESSINMAQNIKRTVKAYWQWYPEALKDFRENSNNRPLYHKEYCREYQTLDYKIFYNYSINRYE